MRIISGKLKNKSINFLKNSTTRPLKDSVKENIFNILNHSNLIEVEIAKANILDIYSGTGSFGFECISRGAKKVTYVEQNNAAMKVLKKNIVKLSIEKQTIVINDMVENIFEKYRKDKYNIFFLDPPFNDNKFLQNLHFIKKYKFYNKKHIVIIHREKSSKDNLDSLLKTLIIKQYGRSKIIFGTFN